MSTVRPSSGESGAAYPESDHYLRSKHYPEAGLRGSAPPAGRGFSPLDEELELESGGLTPNLAEDMVLLGSWMPFGAAVRLISHFRKVAVSEARVHRATERSGATYVELQTAHVESLEKEMPEAVQGGRLCNS